MPTFVYHGHSFYHQINLSLLHEDTI
uniref:Uncharacterized protein n=1 Tax=Rhizophora mucronata TaxID=61149 RepID=A0A2P2K2R5_RHIMU